MQKKKYLQLQLFEPLGFRGDDTQKFTLLFFGFAGLMNKGLNSGLESGIKTKALERHVDPRTFFFETIAGVLQENLVE